jgi:hypothetical protein
VVLQVPSYNHFSLLVLVYHWFQANTLHGVGPLLSHVIMISLVPSCIYYVRLSKRMSYSITPRIDSVWKFLPRWVMSSSMLKFEKVLFHSEHPIELIYQEDRVMKCNTTKSWKTIQFYKVLCCPRTKGKVAWVIEKSSSFQLSRCPSCYAVNTSFIISCAISFLNLGTRFLLKGEGCNVPCYEILNYLP